MDHAPHFVHEQFATTIPDLHDGRDPIRHPVLIAGGGPVGLAVALALARRGIASLVVEADDSVCIGSRAICLSRRTLEILDRLGVLAPFEAKGLPWTGGRSYFGDTEVLHFLMHDDDDQRLAPMTNLQQYYIEQFLLEAVLQQAALIDLRWGTRVTSVDRQDDHVSVTLASGDVSYEADADYVVACDGARSSVRQSLGLQMAGTAYESRYVIADIEIALDMPTERLAWFDPPSAPGRTMLMHKQPDNLWRFDYQLEPGEDGETMVRPEHVAPVIARHLAMLGITMPWSIVWTSMYRATAVSLERYRHGRVLFAGDAAHLVPIFGVRGLNSGFDDAYNLAWKLAYVIEGRADARLLDSFSLERRHGWEVNVANAMKSTEFMAPPSRGFAIMRDAALSLANRHPALKSLINPRQSSTITYSTSPLNAQTSQESLFAGGPVPGQPIAEMPLTDAHGRRTFLTQAISDGFTVLLFCDDLSHSDRELIRTVSEPDDHPVAFLNIAGSRSDAIAIPVLLDGAARAATLYDAKAGTTYLVRPDGHVCGRWRQFSWPSVSRAIDQALAGKVAA